MRNVNRNQISQLTLFPRWSRSIWITAWEQRKLGELIQLGGSGGTPSANNPDYYGGDIPFLSIADINGRDITNTAKTLTDEGLQNSAAWIVPSGAVSLAMYASVGKVGIIRQDTATSQAFYNMVFDNEALRDFVFTRLEKAETDSEWEPYISTGTQRNLNADKVKSFSLDVPSKEEASEISAYFANLDTLITLHQRKCQYRGLYGCLSWEQRKLGEIFEEYSEKNRADLPPLTIIQGGGTVYRDESNRNLQFDKNSLSNYKAVNPDDFIVHLRSFEGGLEKATCCGLISPAYHTFHGDGIDSDFYYLYFRSKRFIDTDLKPHVYGIRDGRSIDIDGMKTIPIPWTTVNEQRAIGGFYNSFDSFITLHQ